MKKIGEFLAFGDVADKLKELNFQGTQTYVGCWFSGSISVYEAKDEHELDRIMSDESDWSNVEGCIRISEGSTMGSLDDHIIVNGVDMWSWTTPNDNYDKLENYFDSILITSYRNVTALMVDLAQFNSCPLSSLLKTYQG